MRDAAQPTRSGGRARCPPEALLPSRKILALWATPSCAEHAQTPSGAPDASSSIGIFRRSRDSESSRENSDKIFDRFSPPGSSWSPNLAPKAVLWGSSARRAASSYPWPSPRRAAQDRAFRIGCVTIHANSEPVDRRRVSLPLCISKWALRSLISFIQQGR